jgi:hypothetical protein
MIVGIKRDKNKLVNLKTKSWRKTIKNRNAMEMKLFELKVEK